MLFKRDLERPVEFTGQRFIAIVSRVETMDYGQWDYRTRHNDEWSLESGL